MRFPGPKLFLCLLLGLTLLSCPDMGEAGPVPSSPEPPVVKPGNRTLYVNWTPVDGADSYQVWISAEPDLSRAVLYQRGIKKFFLILEDLENRQAYHVWIRGENSSGPGQFSAYRSGTPQPDAGEIGDVNWTGGPKGWYTLRLYDSDREFPMVCAAGQGGKEFPTGTDDGGTAVLERGFCLGETEVTVGQATAILQWAWERNKFSLNSQAPNGVNSLEAKWGDRQLLDLSPPAGPIGFSPLEGFSAVDGSEDYPASRITWYGAVMLCNWLTEMRDGGEENLVYSGMDDDWDASETVGDASRSGYRLPSSEEWEYAARDRGPDATNTVPGYDDPYFTRGRSGSGARYAYDDNALGSGEPARAEYDSLGVYKYFWDGSWQDTGRLSAEPVKSREKNALGLYDMAGNLSEWCFDPAGTGRIVRGGGWSDTLWELQVGAVVIGDPAGTDDSRGFRFCRTLD